MKNRLGLGQITAGNFFQKGFPTQVLCISQCLKIPFFFSMIVDINNPQILITSTIEGGGDGTANEPGPTGNNDHGFS
jgi:hypothetical protein